MRSPVEELQFNVAKFRVHPKKLLIQKKQVATDSQLEIHAIKSK